MTYAKNEIPDPLILDLITELLRHAHSSVLVAVSLYLIVVYNNETNYKIKTESMVKILSLMSDSLYEGLI